jgi:MHS family proline/betaine transporter-like MFS transporter
MVEQVEQPAAGSEDPPDQATVRRAVVASAMGNCIEWFDFGVFSAGVMTTIIGTVFFPHDSVGSATLKSFALIAAAFVIRPFGGMFFGPLGDRLGRQRVLATTIILMSGSTFVIGVLPGYATIGFAAPLLLLAVRLVQGFSTGGEYGGAATFIAEYAPTKRRGLLGSFLEFGTLWGYILGSGLVLSVNLILGESRMHAWGWRIPFLLALPLGLVGLYVRLKLEDTPAFKEMDRSGETADSPLKETLIHHWRKILNLIGRIGRKPLLATAATGYILLSFPSIKLMQIHNPVAVTGGFAIMGALLVLMLAVLGSTFPAMFPTQVRYGAFAIGYNISTSVFGGTSALVIGSLIKVFHTNYIPAFYLVIAGLIALVPILLIPETAGVSIKNIATPGRSRQLATASD